MIFDLENSETNEKYKLIIGDKIRPLVIS